MKVKQYLIFTIIIIFCLFTNIIEVTSAVEDKDKEINLSLSSIDEIFFLVKERYFKNINSHAVLEGSVRSVNKLFSDKGIDTSFILNKKNDDFDVFMSDYRKNLSLILENYGAKVDRNTIIRTAITGLLSPLDDPYTVYFDEEEYKKFNSSLSGEEFDGIGVLIKLDKDNRLTVIEPIKDTPAERAGIKAGDIITQIDGMTTSGLSIEESMNLLGGLRGSTVKLVIERKNEKDFLNFEIVRDRIHVSSVEWKLIEGSIGYIKLTVFGNDTTTDLDKALRELQKSGVRGYILDLRNNGGGYVAAAVDVCSKFMPSNAIVVYIEGRGEEYTYNTYGSTFPELPMVVLVNEYSASASEITAGALQDSKSAVLMGVKTFGKGCIQNIYKLDIDGGALKITTAEYLTPNKRNINKKGLIPDIVVNMDFNKIGEEDDIQLKEAVNYLIGKVTATK